jgi:hypothetical protein
MIVDLAPNITIADASMMSEDRPLIMLDAPEFEPLPAPAPPLVEGAPEPYEPKLNLELPVIGIEALDKL